MDLPKGRGIWHIRGYGARHEGMTHMEEELDSPTGLSGLCRLPPGPASVALARHATRRQLARAGVTNADTLDTAELLASELTSNVVKHAGGRPTLRVLRNGPIIRIEVGDTQPRELPVERRVDTDSESGRGLLLVGALATAWGYERDAEGKLTWAELAIPE